MKEDRSPEPSSPSDQLAHYMRASLRSQAQRTAWQLGALARRVEREAPHVLRRLRTAIEALQLLSAQLAVEQEAAPADLQAEASPSRPVADDREASAGEIS